MISFALDDPDDDFESMKPIIEDDSFVTSIEISLFLRPCKETSRRL